MRFEEACGGWQERRLTQEEAARMLGVCERTFRRFPTDARLPRPTDGSASASSVSRPARRSLTLRPAQSLKPPAAAPCTGVLQSMSLPPSTAPIATGWSDSCRAGFAPAEEWRLCTAHRRS